MKITLKLSLLSTLLVLGSLTQASSADYAIAEDATRNRVEAAFKSLETKESFKTRLHEYIQSNCRKGLQNLIVDALEDQQIGLSKKFAFTQTADSFVWNSYGIPGRNILKIWHDTVRRNGTITKTIQLFNAEKPSEVMYIVEFALSLKSKAPFMFKKETQHYSTTADIKTVSEQLENCPTTDDLTENSLFTNMYNSLYLEQADRETAKRCLYAAAAIVAVDYAASKFVENGLLGFAVKGRSLGIALVSKMLPWNKA